MWGRGRRGVLLLVVLLDGLFGNTLHFLVLFQSPNLELIWAIKKNMQGFLSVLVCNVHDSCSFAAYVFINLAVDWKLLF